MFRGNRLKGNGLRGKFDPSKHRRDRNGRFADKPDEPKPAKRSLGKARVPQAGNGVRKLSLGSTTREQKLALLKKFLDAERLAQKQAKQERLQKLLKARISQSEVGDRKLVGNKPAIAKPEPAKKGKTLAEAKLALKAAKEAEKKAKVEAKEAEANPVAPAKKVEALRKLLTGSYKDVPDLDYTPKYKLNDEGLPKLSS